MLKSTPSRHVADVTERTTHEGTALLRTRGCPAGGRRRTGMRSRRGEAAGPQLLDLWHRRQDLLQRSPEPDPAAHHRSRDRRRDRRGRRRCERDVRQQLAGRRPRPGDRRRAVRRVLRVPQGLDGGVPEPDVDGLPVRRRLRRVHDRAPAGAESRWPEPDSGQRRLRRGIGGRAVRLRHQRPGAARHRGGRHRRRVRCRPDRLHAHPHRPRRAPLRPGVSRRRQRKAGCRCPPTPSHPTRSSTAPRSTSSSASWS